MALFTHVLIALASLAYTAYVFMAPSQAKLNASYGLVVLTLLSGSYLIWSQPAHMVHACVSGLIYTGVVFFGIARARTKFARERSRR